MSKGKVTVSKSVVAIALLIVSTSAISDDEYVLRANYESLIGSEIYVEFYQGLSNVSREVRYGTEGSQGRASLDCEGVNVVTYQSKDRYEYVVATDYCDWQFYGEVEKKSYRETHELQGKTIVVERVGGLWKHRLLKGTPSDEQQQILRRRESRYDTNDLYPDRPVKVGDVWEIPGDVLGIILAPALIDAKGAGTGRLEEIVDYEGTPSALILIEGSFSGEEPSVGDDEFISKIEATIVFEEYRSLKDKLSLYVKVQGEIQLIQEEIVGDPKGKVTISGPFIGIETKRIR